MNRTPEEILAYCEVAIEGPWEIIGGIHRDDPQYGDIREPYSIHSPTKRIFELDGWEEISEANANAEFIIQARDDLPRMAKEVMRLEKENAELRDARETVKGIIAHQTKKILDLRALCGEAAEELRKTAYYSSIQNIGAAVGRVAAKLKAAAEGK